MHQRPRPASRPAPEAPSPSIPPDGKQLSERQAQDQVTKLNQIIQNYHTKAALIILHSRTVLRPIYKDGVKRFNVEVDDTDTLREDLAQWRNCTTTDRRPEPLVIETFIDASQLQKHEELVILDECGKRWDVLEALSDIPGGSEKKNRARNEVILERWFIELGSATTSSLPRDMTHILPTTYKKCIVTFRSLFAYSKFLPAWKFSKRQSKTTSHPALRLQHRILPASKCQHGSPSDTLTIPLHDGTGDAAENYSFGVTESPAGPLSIRVTYRASCEFRVDDSETMLSSRFMGVDDELFRPSLPTENDRGDHRTHNVDVGSLPARHRTSHNPDLSQAYGSMSTFHRADPNIKGSPISALRAARDIGGSPSSPTFMPSPKLGHARLASLSGEDGHTRQRRPSVSYQPFKAPPLSASPGPSAARSPSTREPLSINVNTSQNIQPTPSPRKIPTSSTRPLSAHILPDQAVFSSMSASPKQAPISRYSSSFSHRRGRLSTGGGSKTEEDNNSSGKASISSSSAAAVGQRDSASGVFPVIDTDEDNISDFLKLLDQRKDLLSNGPDGSTFDPASSRRTTTATLSRFQKMKDANTALSDSMTSSLLLHRSNITSSSNKQLPPASTSSPVATAIPSSVPSGVSGSVSSSPGKAISPHTPHTPAVPSRLSSNSVIEYPSPDDPGHIITNTARSRRAPRYDSPLGEASEPEPEPEARPQSQTTTTANAIDIPLPVSPHHPHHRSGAFIPSYRRSSSAAHRRTSTANSNNTATGDEDVPDFLPFPTTTRSISLGAQDRSPPSISELLQAPSPDLENQPLVSSAIDRRENESPQPEGSANDRTTSRYQPRFTQVHDRESQGHTSHTHARRASTRRFSTARSPWVNTNPASSSNPHGNGIMDEDEPLLFTMSDFGAGVNQRTTTEGNALESRRGRDTRRDRDRERNRESDGGGSGSGGGNPCSFHPWD
ncbi:autophagy protein 13 [Microsporum ferrugineum]